MFEYWRFGIWNLKFGIYFPEGMPPAGIWKKFGRTLGQDAAIEDNKQAFSS